jgi:tetratricopeptide (TPR) repeat protein
MGGHIRHVPRLDSALFKYLQNHNFVFELADAHNVKEDGLKVYEEFEVPFQLDGHFWLQYGLYYDRLGDLNSAESMLGKSIVAYPENVFAEHALVRLRLRIAASENTDEPTAKRLIQDAVSSLNRIDARDQTLLDEYPLVTLSFFHIHALLKRGQSGEATRAARDYLSRLNYMQKRLSADNMTRAAIEQLTIF